MGPNKVRRNQGKSVGKISHSGILGAATHWPVGGIGHDEIVVGSNGLLSLEHDPKLAWALAHRERFPVDLNQPEGFTGIRRRCVGLLGAAGPVQPAAVPVQAAQRRQDREPHAGEAAHEERCHRLQDVMRRLEPGHVQRRGLPVFNPARLKLAAMEHEMPRRYWRNLPEAVLIAALAAAATARMRQMVNSLGTKPQRRIPDAAQAPDAAGPAAWPIDPAARRRCRAICPPQRPCDRGC
jgi:hypothetical protein